MSRFDNIAKNELEELERGLAMSLTESCEINTETNNKLQEEISQCIRLLTDNTLGVKQALADANKR